MAQGKVPLPLCGTAPLRVTGFRQIDTLHHPRRAGPDKDERNHRLAVLPFQLDAEHALVVPTTEKLSLSPEDRIPLVLEVESHDRQALLRFFVRHATRGGPRLRPPQRPHGGEVVRLHRSHELVNGFCRIRWCHRCRLRRRTAREALDRQETDGRVFQGGRQNGINRELHVARN